MGAILKHRGLIFGRSLDFIIGQIILLFLIIKIFLSNEGFSSLLFFQSGPDFRILSFSFLSSL